MSVGHSANIVRVMIVPWVLEMLREIESCLRNIIILCLNNTFPGFLGQKLEEVALIQTGDC